MATLRDVPADRRAARLEETIERVSDRRVRSRYLDPDASRAEVRELAEKRGDTACLLDLVDDGGAALGTVWLGDDDGELVVYDAVLERADVATELVPLGRLSDPEHINQAMSQGGSGAAPILPATTAFTGQMGEHAVG